MVIRIAVADKNKEYLDRLMRGLEEYEELSLSFYTESESLKQALRTKRFDIVLCDLSVYGTQLNISEKTFQILLYDEEEKLPEIYDDLPKIIKYQRVSQIYKKILELYADVCGRLGNTADKERAKTVVFYSPIGGCGKTTLSMASAYKLAGQGKRVLYFNMEDIASDAFFLPQTRGKGVSDLLECLGTETNFAVKLQGLLLNKTKNLYYLNHFTSPNDRYEMTVEETEMLLRGFSEAGLFDFIIVDMSTTLDSKTVKIFECADFILLVEKSDKISACRLSGFFEQAHIMNENQGKLFGLMNFQTEKRENGIQQTIPIIETVAAHWGANGMQTVETLAEDELKNLMKILLER